MHAFHKRIREVAKYYYSPRPPLTSVIIAFAPLPSMKILNETLPTIKFLVLIHSACLYKNYFPECSQKPHELIIAPHVCAQGVK